MRSVLTNNYVMYPGFFQAFMRAMSAGIPTANPRNHQIGPGQSTLYTVWKRVSKDSKSNQPEYRKPVIAGSTESARRLSNA